MADRRNADEELLELTTTEIGIIGIFCVFDRHIKQLSEKGERIDPMSVTCFTHMNQNMIRIDPICIVYNFITNLILKSSKH